MPHELAEHEDRGLDVERHRRVLERRPVPVTHEVVDQARRPRRIRVDVGQRLFALGRDPGRPDHVGVRRGVLDQFHGHVAAESNARHGSHCAWAGCNHRVHQIILPVIGPRAAAHHAGLHRQLRDRLSGVVAGSGQGLQSKSQASTGRRAIGMSAAQDEALEIMRAVWRGQGQGAEVVADEADIKSCKRMADVGFDEFGENSRTPAGVARPAGARNEAQSGAAAVSRDLVLGPAGNCLAVTWLN